MNLRTSWLVSGMAALAVSVFSGSASAALPDLTQKDAWHWYQNDSSFPMNCIDGSATGFGYYVPTGWNGKVLFVLDGGGACFDQQSCANKADPVVLAATVAALQTDVAVKPDPKTVPFIVRTGYSGSDFTKDITDPPPIVIPPFTVPGKVFDGNGVDHTRAALNRGVFDRTSSINPFQKYMTVFVPYCTGDMHIGNNVDTVSHVNGRQPSGKTFVGLRNSIYTFSAAIQAANAALGHQPSTVVLSGGSAGGFGAIYLYGILRTMLRSSSNGTKIVVVSDGGMPLSSGRSSNGTTFDPGGQGFFTFAGTPSTKVSSWEEYEADAWGTSWNIWQPAGLSASTPLGDGNPFIPLQALAVKNWLNGFDSSSVGNGDRFAFITGTSDWMYWYLTNLYMSNDTASGHTPRLSDAVNQLAQVVGLHVLFPVMNTTKFGLFPWNQHHVFIEDDVSTWDSNGSNLSQLWSSLPL
jgi:hypothetical protein